MEFVRNAFEINITSRFLEKRRQGTGAVLVARLHSAIGFGESRLAAASKGGAAQLLSQPNGDISEASSSSALRATVDQRCY